MSQREVWDQAASYIFSHLHEKLPPEPIGYFSVYEFRFMNDQDDQCYCFAFHGRHHWQTVYDLCAVSEQRMFIHLTRLDSTDPAVRGAILELEMYEAMRYQQTPETEPGTMEDPTGGEHG